jgi:hypothetical protein
MSVLGASCGFHARCVCLRELNAEAFKPSSAFNLSWFSGVLWVVFKILLPPGSTVPVRVMPAPRDAPRTPNLLSNTRPSPPPISTNMAPIDDAVAAFEARSLGEQSL